MYLHSITPEIFRKRLLVEGYIFVDVQAVTIKDYFREITNVLGIRIYGEPIVHETSVLGKDAKGVWRLYAPYRQRYICSDMA